MGLALVAAVVAAAEMTVVVVVVGQIRKGFWVEHLVFERWHWWR